MSRLTRILSLTVACCLSLPAVAEGTSELSTGTQDQRTRQIQEKVDRLFEEGEYERSFFIYRHELVPLGDKYAQYMVGYMYETGIGTSRDPVKASAWYRLAAERGTREFLAVRDQIMRTFSPEEHAASDAIYHELRAEFGDLMVLFNLIKRDFRELRTRTGSRLGSDTSPVAVIEARSGSVRSGGGYYGSIQTRLEERLEKLVELGDLSDIEIDADDLNIVHLEAEVRKAMLRPES